MKIDTSFAREVLVLGNEPFAEELASRLGCLGDVRCAGSAAEVGTDAADVVVVAGREPVEELTEVRVHPWLHGTPVVVVAPGRPMAQRAWQRIGVWPITAADDVASRCAQIVLGFGRVHERYAS